MIAVLFLLLGNFTAALIVALVIPLSMLFAVTGMVEGRISANLLSLGAIDFGIIVDGAVVMVENILRRFAERRHALGRPLDRTERLARPSPQRAEVARPTLFGVAIIMIVYLPILTLTGIEGKMFRPMAQVVLLALAARWSSRSRSSRRWSLCSCAARRRSTRAASCARRSELYVPTLALVRCAPRVGGRAAARRLRRLRAPRRAARAASSFPPSTRATSPCTRCAFRHSLTQERRHAARLEQTLRARFPEVDFVFAQIGTAEIANDPMPPERRRRVRDPEAARRRGRIAAVPKPTSRREWRRSSTSCRATPTSSPSRSRCASTS